MKIEFTEQQLAYTINLLAEQPFKNVVELIQSIQNQLNTPPEPIKAAETKLQEVKK